MVDRRLFRGSGSRIIVAGFLSGLMLTACKPNAEPARPSSAPPPLAALPLETSSAPPMAPAPAASALPPAPRSRVGRLANPSDRYAFADRAYDMATAFGDAPPDYTFDYGEGERPWVWRGDDRSMRVAEPLPDGGDRYYYYEPDAELPYLVWDSDYRYGYDDGVLVVIYDRQGRPLPPDYLDRQASVAGRLLARARAIYEASQHRQRLAVAQAHWAARRNEIDAERERWAESQAANEEWRAYHAMHGPQEQAHWEAERYRREAQAARFAEAINDRRAADRAWQAAREAQMRAGAAGQLPQPQAPGPGGFLGLAPKQQPAAPPPPPPQRQASQDLRGQPSQDHRPPWQGTGGPGPEAQVNRPPPPNLGQTPAVQAEAQRRAAQQAQAAAHQAQIEAERRASLQAQAKSQADAAAARQAQAQALAARQAQMDAQRKAQIEAQARAQAEAARQAQAAAHQAQVEAEHRASLQAQAKSQADAAAARQAQAQALAARQAQMEAQRKAQVEARARAQAEAARQAQAQAAITETHRRDVAETTTGAPSAPRSSTDAKEADAWSGALKTNTVEAFRDYLRAYPGGAHARDARAALRSLRPAPEGPRGGEGRPSPE
jgi:hypothetical protein